MQYPPPRYASPNIYEESQGAYFIDFIEDFCHNVKTSFAANAGDPLVLREWQKDLIYDLFEVKPSGSRRYRTGLIGLPKKNSKSLLGSALALAILVAENEVGAEVYSVAAARDQARIVFEAAKQMVELDADLSGILKVYRNHIENTNTGAIYRVLSADASTNDGLNPSFVIFDEVHRQPNDEFWSVMTNAIGTRPNAMVLGITTAGHDRDSLCYRLYDYGKRVSTGEIDDPSFFFRWWEPAEDAPYDSPETWASANPGYGDFLSAEDFHSTVQKTPENQFRRYRLNQWTATQDAWLRAGSWEALASERRLEPGEAICLGFDGSYANDSTGLVACTIREPFHVEVLQAWEKPEEADEWRVDVSDVKEAIRQACLTYQVKEVACDPSYYQLVIQQLADEGLPMVEIPQSVPRRIQATKIFEDIIYEARLTHTGDPRLARHIRNCVVKEDRKSGGYYFTKDTRRSHIDLAIAALFAVDRANFYKDSGSKQPELIVL